MRTVRPDQAVWSFSSQQATLRRLNKAFAGFFRRAKTAKPGVKRAIRGLRARPGSTAWSGPKTVTGPAGWPNGVGCICRVLARSKLSCTARWRGRVKTIQIKRQGRRWMLVLSCDDVPTGVDVGVVSFASTSDGEYVDNPRWARAAAGHLAAAQQRLRRARCGGNNRAAKRETVVARHRKIANQRKDFHHKQARALVGPIRPDRRGGLEDRKHVAPGQTCPGSRQSGQLLPNGARAKTGLNRSTSGAGWASSSRYCAPKRKMLGGFGLKVDPRHTYDGCERCVCAAVTNRVTQAEFGCQRCGHRAPADVHAARNILRAGLAHHAYAA